MYAHKQLEQVHVAPGRSSWKETASTATMVPENLAWHALPSCYLFPRFPSGSIANEPGQVSVLGRTKESLCFAMGG
eukprot:scaffold2858_cov659-Pavlova_lutheri.AAC.44